MSPFFALFRCALFRCVVALALVSAGPWAAAVEPVMGWSRYESYGPYVSEVLDARWLDATRARTLPVRVRVPSGVQEVGAQGMGAQEGGPADRGSHENVEPSPRRYPVIVFTHGLAGSLDTGQLWAQHWASHGFVVIHVQHPGSDEAAMAQAKNPRRALRKATDSTQYAARLRDLRFVLDELDRLRTLHDEAALERESPERARLARIADWAHIGLAGHSMGAISVQRMAGQNTMGKGAQGPGPEYEPRVHAFLAFSPMARHAQAAPQFAHIDKPFFSVTGSLDGRGPVRRGASGSEAVRVQRVVPFEGMRGENKYFLNLFGAGHMVFAGDASRSTTASDQVRDFEHVRITRTLSTAYWLAWLLDDAQARAALQEGARYVGQAGQFNLKAPAATP